MAGQQQSVQVHKVYISYLQKHWTPFFPLVSMACAPPEICEWGIMQLQQILDNAPQFHAQQTGNKQAFAYTLFMHKHMPATHVRTHTVHVHGSTHYKHILVVYRSLY